MKVLYYDCFSGISGDMNLGAMIDLGVDVDYLNKELSKIKGNKYNIKVEKSSKMGIAGTKVNLSSNNHSYDYRNIHRNIEDIKNIINDSNLNKNVKSISMDIFMKIAEAESKVHGKPINEVFFHEVGSMDSIIDVVGAAICFDYLNIDKIMASTVELGGGFVKCAHGVLPVPAPVVVEIMKGIPIKSGTVNFETTTPTGAAILATQVDEFTDDKRFIINKIAYGIGHRDMEIPNVLRVFLGDYKKSEELIDEEDWIIECNIDDMNPEIYDYIMEKLFQKGASDVYFTPIIMKKNRPSIKLSVLCKNTFANQIEEVLLMETTTLGIRKYNVKKKAMDRKIMKINTDYGYVNIKEAYYNNEKIKWKVEYEDCKKISEEFNIPINKVYKMVEKEIFKKNNKINNI